MPVSCVEGRGCLYIRLHLHFGVSLLLQEGRQAAPAVWGSRTWGGIFSDLDC